MITWDNGISPLRDATSSQNAANTPARKNNKLGIKGVHLSKNGTYRTQIRIAGKNTFLGAFSTAEEAKAVYDAAANQNHSEFARSA